MLQFVPYTRQWTQSVCEFNQRMLSGGLERELCFPCPPDISNGGSNREYFLAVDGSQVRGAYFLTRERWASRRDNHEVCNFRLPLSEGFIDCRYRGIGKALLQHALSRCPSLYCLGLGHKNRPLPQMLLRQNWPMMKTAFYFRFVHPRQVLRDLAWLRTDPRLRLAMDAAALSGGAVGIRALQWLRTQKPAGQGPLACVRDFGDWADVLWDRVRCDYSLLADRTSAALNLRYPKDDPRFLKLAVGSTSKTTTGWAVALATTMNGHRHFGNLRVGTIVDCLALPGEEHRVIHAATEVLEERDVDLIVSNQTHRNWCAAFDRCGYLSGPTNRFFTPSPDLARLLDPFEQKFQLTHLTRGDGAGPIHL